jgi:KDO2-lipid IV(A) lauroyltransferase
LSGRHLVTDPSTLPLSKRIQAWCVNAVLVTLIWVVKLLPYATRVRTMGWITAHIIGPVAGYRRAALKNLAHIWPELPEEERAKIATACLDNAGRTFIEFYSTEEFPRRLAANPLQGPGWEAFQAADKAGRPVILVTGHLGNYDAVRAALVGRDFAVGGLYRNMSNPYFNAHYVRSISSYGGPGFAQGRRGTAGFVRHLRDGGKLCLAFDQHVFEAPVLDFLGHPARTALSAAELALRFNALLIPFYGIRKADGIEFDTILEAPVPHSDAKTMTQALNDSLSARIREHPGQWFWVHRRWRP